MPDATEWLVEEVHSDTERSWWRPLTLEDAILGVQQIVAKGGTAHLYQRIDFTVKVGVTVKAPRKRRKNSPPADKPGSDTPTGPGNGEAGEPKGAASPSSLRVNGREESEVRVADPTAPHVLASPYSCEARFHGDPVCPGPAKLDAISNGWFCSLHLDLTPERFRVEMHRLHASRNRPVRVAHAR